MNNSKKEIKHIIFPLLCHYPTLTLQHLRAPITSSSFQGTIAPLLIWMPWSGFCEAGGWALRKTWVPRPFLLSREAALNLGMEDEHPSTTTLSYHLCLVKPAGKSAPQTCFCLMHSRACQLLFGPGCIQVRQHLRTHFVKLSGTCRATAGENTDNRFWQVSWNKATGESGDQM